MANIVVYRYKGEWYPADQVRAEREVARCQNNPNDDAYFPDANLYTMAALRRRREYGRDVPEWVELDEGETEKPVE